MIPEYPEFIINGIRYKVCPAETQKTLAKKSGEAKIFIVENGGHKFALKLYIPGHSPNHDILEKIKKAGGGFVVRLHDHGKWMDPQHPGLVLDYEIMDYAPYGSMADLKFNGDEKLLKQVVQRMAFCLKQCHDTIGIVHRDIKPENFLFTNNSHTEFVLTDFGIARELKGRSSIKVDTAKSSYFASPESCMSSDGRTTQVGTPTDYYSMGMTLLAMWVGLDNFYNLFPYDQIGELDGLKRNNKVLTEMKDMLNMSDHVQSLLEGLLEFADGKRAGFDEVMRWYKGETLKHGEQADTTGKFRVMFDETANKVAHSPQELAKLMTDDIEFAKTFLYRGMALKALQDCQLPRLALQIDDVAQKLYPRPEEQATGVYAAALILDPSLPYIDHKNRRFATPKEIARALWADRGYYSTSLTKKYHPLWAFLNVRGGDLRKEIATLQATCSRDNMGGLYALCSRLDPSMPLYDSAGITPLKDLAAIAKELWAQRSVYTSVLKSPDAPLWTYLRNNGSQKLIDAVKDYPSRIASMGQSALYGLCIELDRSTPYYGIDGKPLTTPQQLGDELWTHLDKYKTDLVSPAHLFWQYLRSQGNAEWTRIADTYPDLVKKHKEVYVFDLVYRLDPSKPFTVQRVTDNKWYAVSSLKEIHGIIRDYGLTDFSIEVLTRPHFTTWLKTRKDAAEQKCGVALESLVKGTSNVSTKGWYLLYMLSPEVGLTFDNTCKTTAEIGAMLNKELTHERVPFSLTAMLSDPTTFGSSRLAQYMRARKMDSYVTGISKIIDVQSNISAHKAAPYDINVARWKVVQYLGATPYYKTQASQKVVNSLSQVRSLSMADRNKEANSGLAEFVSLFFHENVRGSYSAKGLQDYYDFLSTNLTSNRYVQNGRSVESAHAKAIADRDSAWRSLKTTRLVTTIVCLVPMIIMVGVILGIALSDGQETIKEAFMTIGTVLAWIICIIGAIAGLAEGGLFGIVIGGLLGYWIPFWIFKWISPLAPWMLALLILGAAVFCTIRLYRKSKDKYIPDSSSYNNLVSQSKLEVLTQAFGTYKRTFGSSSVSAIQTFDASRQLAHDSRKATLQAALMMVGVMLVSGVLTYFLANTVKNVETVTESTYYWFTPDEIAGNYTGEFHGRDANMTLRNDGYQVEGTVTIDYSTPMVQNVSGSFSTNCLYLTVNDGSGATYQGNCNNVDGKIVFSGNYENPSKGTQHSFSFTKIE